MELSSNPGRWIDRFAFVIAAVAVAVSMVAATATTLAALPVARQVWTTVERLVWAVS